MNKRYIIVMALILFSWVFLQPFLGWAAVSSHTKIEVLEGGPFVDMFSFNMPAQCNPSPCSEDRVVVAKYIVDDTTNDLNFELRATSTNHYIVTQFSTMNGGAAVTLMDEEVLPAPKPAAYIYARFTGESVAPNFRIIKIQIRFDNNYDAFPPGESWTIQAKPSSGDDHYYGFWADGQGESEVEAMVTKPHLINYIDDSQLTNFTLFTDFISPTNISFGDVHINLANQYLPDEYFQFRNVGTKAITITGVNPISMPSSPYNIENYPSPPMSSVLPMAAFSRRITCHPTELGPISDVNIGLTTDSPEVGTLNLNLMNSTGIKLNAAILFDLSGSMLTDRQGMPDTSPYEAPADQQKVYFARWAALELKQYYEHVLPDALLSLYSYPDTNGNCPKSEELIMPDEIKHSSQSQAFDNHLSSSLGHSDLIRPKDAYAKTPMAEGIAKVYGVLKNHDTYERTAVFHFGDGQHNCHSAGNKKTPADWYNDTTFKNADIPFFTIPYGAYDADWMNTFTQLATKTGGAPFPADITDGLELQKQFKKALGEALDLETLKDPVGQIDSGTNKSHEVCVTESSYQLVFTVHWISRSPNAVEVKVETPDHQFITPSTAFTTPDQAGYVSGENYAGYIVHGDYLRGDNGSGLWKLHIKGNATTSYAYQIFSKGRMKTEASFDLGHIGQAANIGFMIKDGTKFVREANVTAAYDMPTNSFNNYLAGTPINPKLVFEAPETIGGRPATMAERKLYALTHLAKKPFRSKRHTGELKFFDEQAKPVKQNKTKLSAMSTSSAVGIDSVYKTTFKEANVDGLYNVAIRVTGLTARGECFEREFYLARWADVGLSAKLITQAVTWEDVQVGPYFDPDQFKELKEPPPKGYIRKSIVFTPKDESGNFFGIGRASEISFALKNADTIGSVVDNLDGSYTRVILYKEGEVPSVTVTAQGVTSPEIKPIEKPPVIPPFIIWIIIIAILVVIILILWKRKRA